MKIYNVENLSVVQERNRKEKQREKNVEKVPDIEENVDLVAETVGITLDDTVAIAETVGSLLDLVVELQNEIELLKGGN